MTRTLFGGGSSDVAVKVGGDGDFEPDTTSAGDAYTTGPARTGGTHMTDLALFQPGAMGTPGEGTSTVVAQPDGEILVWGPDDDYKGPFWIQYAFGPRRQLFPVDLVSRLAAVEDALADGDLYVLPEGGMPASDLDEETQGLIAGAIQGDGDGTGIVLDDGSALALGDAEQVVRVNAAGTAFETATPAGQQFRDSPDVDFGTPTDGSLPVYDLGNDQLEMRDAGAVFAPVDSNGDLDPSAYPNGFIPLQVVNPGGSLASWTQPGNIVFVRDTSVSSLALDSVGTGNNGTTPGSSQTATNSLAFSNGDYAVVCVSMSAEATFPTSVGCVGPTNIGTMTLATSQVQGSTVATYIFYAKASGSVSTGSTFTVTASGGTASRDDWAVRVIRLQGIVSSSALDLAASSGAANSASPSIGPVGPTSASSEIAIACFGYNSATAGTLNPTGGWSQVGTPVESTDTSPRTLVVLYRVLTASASLTASATTTNPSVWAGSMASFKAA